MQIRVVEGHWMLSSNKIARSA